MADPVQVRSAQLFELLGAALVAVVQADAQAARSTLEFVESVGFTEEAVPAGAVDATPALRMATFRYTKRDENNELAEFVAEVPLLSMLPVPSLQVRKAVLNLTVKIDEIVKRDAPAIDEDDTRGDRRPRLADILGTKRTELIGRPAPARTPGTSQVASTNELQVEITLQQADVPVGMGRLFDLMDQAITDRRA